MLKQKIQNDMKAAMLTKDEARLSAIRMLKSALQYFEIAKGGAGYEATDEDVLDVIGKEVKKRRESIEMYEKGGRKDAAESEKKELELLQSYLPKQMSEDEIRTIVKEAIASTGAVTIQDMGKVMSSIMPKTKGKAENSIVSKIVKEELSA